MAFFLEHNRIASRSARRLSKVMVKRLGWALLSFLLFSCPWGINQSNAQVESAIVSSTTNQIRLVNQASYSYSDPSLTDRFLGSTNGLETANFTIDPGIRTGGGLIDPLGQLLGCGGEALSSYDGFSMVLYRPNPDDPSGTELGELVSLTPTEAVETAGNGITAGIAPNLLNANPFPLSSNGEYNFLLDPERGQTEPGQSYILVIQPPSNSIYPERRVKLTVEAPVADAPLSYRAIALDGEPISADGSNQLSENTVLVPNAETIGLSLTSIQLPFVLCPAEPISITKTASQATAEPGDTVIYRVTVRNQSDVPLNALQFTDFLPRGLQLIPHSVQAQMGEQKIEVTTELDPKSNQISPGQRSTAKLSLTEPLPAQAVLNLLYAVRITPDAVRGSGQNAVTVAGRRQDNGFRVQDGPATHELQIRPGITADCGLLIGRVFEDLDLDGEQQRGEPGLANAVIYLQDGNRVVTDENGLFSVENVLPGHHTGVLDLTSVPGYDFAPNQNRRELRSGSRLVRLAPSSMARMNFPVISLDSPQYGEVNQ